MMVESWHYFQRLLLFKFLWYKVSIWLKSLISITELSISFMYIVDWKLPLSLQTYKLKYSVLQLNGQLQPPLVSDHFSKMQKVS